MSGRDGGKKKPLKAPKKYVLIISIFKLFNYV